MNNYLIDDLVVRTGYNKKQAAFARLLAVLYPQDDPSLYWEKRYSSDDINNEIEKILSDILGQRTPDLCIDYFVRLFGDNSFDTYRNTIMQEIHEVVKHKDIIRKNIEERCL
ncbi:MAG: hypothetical protein IJ666_05295 [Ruminococcus sp.]|nr:hypothetical protein [Ruminococcus sp.]